MVNKHFQVTDPLRIRQDQAPFWLTQLPSYVVRKQWHTRDRKSPMIAGPAWSRGRAIAEFVNDSLIRPCIKVREGANSMSVDVLG